MEKKREKFEIIYQIMPSVIDAYDYIILENNEND